MSKSFKEFLVESSDPKSKLQARIKKLRADLKDMSVTPQSQEAADAIDDVRDELADAEKELKSMKEGAEEASVAYEHRFKEVQLLLQELNQLLVQHSQAQKRSASSWGYAGDLAHVAELLRDVKEFMSNK